MRGLPRGPIPALIAFALAALVYVFGVRLPIQAEPVLEGWVETPCTVTATEITTTTEEEPWGNGMREYTRYLPTATLQYAYDGQPHQFVEALPSTRDRKEAERRVQAFADVPQRVCLVNPDNPAEARIPGNEVTGPMRVAVLLGVGLLVVIGLIALIAPFVLPKELGVDGPPPQI